MSFQLLAERQYQTHLFGQPTALDQMRFNKKGRLLKMDQTNFKPVVLSVVVACSLAVSLTQASSDRVEPSSSRVDASQASHWKEDYAYMLGIQAFIYGYPAIKNASVRHDWVEAHRGSVRAQGNKYTHYSKLVGPEYQFGTSMNRDTLYSLAWSFVGDGPLIFSMPKNPDNRYYSIQFTEWYTDAFGYMGSRTTGVDGANYLIHAAGWNGDVPDGIDKVIESPTPWFLAVGRTYTTNTDEDLEIVHQIQREYKITPLQEWGKTSAMEAEPIEDVLDAFPPGDPLGPFKLMNASMKENPPPSRDLALMRLFALVGLGPEANADLDQLDNPTKRGLIRALNDAPQFLQKVSEAVGSITNANKTVNGWVYNPNNWGRMAESSDFLGRSATQSWSGGIENLIEEAVKLRTFTDSEGLALNGNYNYQITFEKEQIPTVNAFWSITLYDNNFNLIENVADKYAVRDIDENIHFEADGSLKILLQHEPPAQKNVNWIPTPENKDFNLFFRAYLPSGSFLDQSYVPPAVVLLKTQ